MSEKLCQLKLCMYGKKCILETKDPSSDSEAREDCSHPRKLRNYKQLTTTSLVLKQLKKTTNQGLNILLQCMVKFHPHDSLQKLRSSSSLVFPTFAYATTKYSFRLRHQFGICKAAILLTAMAASRGSDPSQLVK